MAPCSHSSATTAWSLAIIYVLDTRIIPVTLSSDLLDIALLFFHFDNWGNKCKETRDEVRQLC